MAVSGKYPFTNLTFVSPTAVPPVAKAIDYGHYQYELKKKQHEAKKKRKLERWNGVVEEEELTEAEKEEIKRKEVEFWKDVKL